MLKEISQICCFNSHVPKTQGRLLVPGKNNKGLNGMFLLPLSFGHGSEARSNPDSLTSLAQRDSLLVG